MSSPPESILPPVFVNSKKPKEKYRAPHIAVLCSPMGSTALETLAPLALLSHSAHAAKVELVSYSETTRGCRIAPGLSLQPQHALLDSELPNFDAWVVPPLAASQSPALWKRLMEVLSNASHVLALGESVRFAAIALDHASRPPALAVPYSTQKEISKSFPEARWIAGKRVVIHSDTHRTVISSPGLAATPEAVHALEESLSGHAPALSADPTLPHSIPRLSIPDLATFIRWVGFRPHPLHARLLLQDGANEWALGTLLEVLGKSGAVVFSYPATAQITTAHGFELHISPRGPLDRKTDLIVTPTTSFTSEQTVLEFLYGAIGRGSEHWISVLATRLLVRKPNLSYHDALPADSTPTCFFLGIWGATTLGILVLYWGARRFYFHFFGHNSGNSTRHQSRSPLFQKRRGKSK